MARGAKGTIPGVKGTVEKVTFIESTGGKVATIKTPEGGTFYKSVNRKPRGVTLDTLKVKDE
jgi:hypothetical protein